jgi:transposase
MQAVIGSVASAVPATLTEIRKLGRTLKQRATDILALFDRPGTSNGPTEAINGTRTPPRQRHARHRGVGCCELAAQVGCRRGDLNPHAL